MMSELEKQKMQLQQIYDQLVEDGRVLVEMVGYEKITNHIQKTTDNLPLEAILGHTVLILASIGKCAVTLSKLSELEMEE